MRWFEMEAPIRLKTLVAFGSLIGIMAAMASANLVMGHWILFGLDMAALGAAALLARAYCEAICTP